MNGKKKKGRQYIMETLEQQIADAEIAKSLDGKSEINQLDLLRNFCGLKDTTIENLEVDEVNKLTTLGIKRMQGYCERTKSTISLNLGTDKDGNPFEIKMEPDKDQDSLLKRINDSQFAKEVGKLGGRAGKDILRKSVQGAERAKQKVERVIDKAVQEFGR